MKKPPHSPAMRGPLGALPSSALKLIKEFARHVLRRPVVGVAVAARTEDGGWLLIRRADTNTWCLPGGTLEWGESLRSGIARELAEEAGVVDARVERLVGVYSGLDRDPRFHAVTVAVLATVQLPVRPPDNPLEIREARVFREDELPSPLAMGMEDILAAARRGGPPEID